MPAHRPRRSDDYDNSNQKTEYMSLSRISEVNIDLWEKQKVQFPAHPDVNIIMGVNGSGKTTFLNPLQVIDG